MYVYAHISFLYTHIHHCAHTRMQHFAYTHRNDFVCKHRPGIDTILKTRKNIIHAHKSARQIYINTTISHAETNQHTENNVHARCVTRTEINELNTYMRSRKNAPVLPSLVHHRCLSHHLMNQPALCPWRPLRITIRNICRYSYVQMYEILLRRCSHSRLVPNPLFYVSCLFCNLQ